MNHKTNITDVKVRLILVQLGLIVTFLILALLLVYWSVIRGPSILARDDNPRQVDAELHILRGRILDANGLTLAETISVEGEPVRHYASGGTGPLVGYYSFRHGTSGIEDGYDQVLSGQDSDFWTEFWSQDLLHQQPVGRDIRLTLDSNIQKRAETLLEEEQGAAIVFSIADMVILSMVSHPNFDPNLLDEQFDFLAQDESAPLLNRATQGLYQPGFILQPFIIASLASADLIDLGLAVSSISDLDSSDRTVTSCKIEPSEATTWLEITRFQCPISLLDISKSLTSEFLNDIFVNLGFHSAPEIVIETEFSDEGLIGDLEMALNGQDSLALNPLQIAMVTGALANDGELKQPSLIAAFQDSNGQWISNAPVADGRIIFDSSVANQILASLPVEENLIEYSTLVSSGTEQSSNAWYIGLGPSTNPQYGVIMVLENQEDLSQAEGIGRSLLTGIISNE